MPLPGMPARPSALIWHDRRRVPRRAYWSVDPIVARVPFPGSGFFDSCSSAVARSSGCRPFARRPWGFVLSFRGFPNLRLRPVEFLVAPLRCVASRRRFHVAVLPWRSECAVAWVLLAISVGFPRSWESPCLAPGCALPGPSSWQRRVPAAILLAVCGFLPRSWAGLFFPASWVATSAGRSRGFPLFGVVARHLRRTGRGRLRFGRGMGFGILLLAELNSWLIFSG